MIGKDQVGVISQVPLQAHFLVRVQGDSFVRVIGQAGTDKYRLLRKRQQTVLLHRHGDPFRGMGVQDTTNVLPRLMHSTVNDEAGRVDVVRAIQQLGARHVHFYQVGCSDFVEHQAVGIDQEFFGSRNLGGNMRVD
ncbi:hypothetical protein D3C78_1487520 [compost metagenome]